MASPSDTDKARSQREINNRLTVLINRANGAILDTVNGALEEFDLSPTQYATLLMLGCNPGTSSAGLARLVNITPQTMGVVVTKLETRGLVMRQPAEIHSRVLTITLTEDGNRLLQSADAAIQDVERHLADSLSAPEVEHLKALLGRVTRTLLA
ncbi:MarR family winged helix-turn-helix transcriptional regulator [Paenarthrobacter sp. NPDC058040]|uniref:MarR family winged helix-turn-helix transcriptional regulator n=1 Tax=unclassified Paenarthrobacter TaxID=2634190 RepID=UPI0036DA95D0